MLKKLLPCSIPADCGRKPPLSPGPIAGLTPAGPELSSKGQPQPSSQAHFPGYRVCASNKERKSSSDKPRVAQGPWVIRCMSHVWDLWTQGWFPGSSNAEAPNSAHELFHLCSWLPLPPRPPREGRPEHGLSLSRGVARSELYAWRGATQGRERLPSTLVRWAPGAECGADTTPLAGGAGYHFTGHPRRQRKGPDAGQRGTAGREVRKSRSEETSEPNPPGRRDRGQRWGLDTGQAVSGGRRREAGPGVPGHTPPARRGHAPRDPAGTRRAAVPHQKKVLVPSS